MEIVYKDDEKELLNLRKRSTICKCPNCGALHKYKIAWVGRAKQPPIYCKNCKYRVDNLNYTELSVGK